MLATSQEQLDSLHPSPKLPTMPERFFNNAGPNDCQRHYCLDPLARIDLEDVETLIDQARYFVLHAPRQTGKTSSLLALMQHLNAQTTYRCLYVNLEIAQAAREAIPRAIRLILDELVANAEFYLQDATLRPIRDEIIATGAEEGGFAQLLMAWSQRQSRPLVLLLDEVDALVGDTLIALLRQLRAGYSKRPAAFPQSIILCGVRDVRDYRIHSSRSQAIITGGSAFNIKAKSIRMGDFSRDDTFTLLRQHTQQTGQRFTDEALACIWWLTQGQPWLVNALAYEITFGQREHRDRRRTLTEDAVYRAKESLIAERVTHLDQLADKLGEARVRRVIEPLLAGDTERHQYHTRDIEYLVDLGLIKREPSGQLRIANSIYQEIIPRELTWALQSDIHQEQSWYVQPDGRLDLPKLLGAFQQFFREHSEHWLERFDYKEAGPQLLMQAFLQRIVNGGGRIEREYGLGRMRTDLLIVWPYPQGTQKVVIELKILHKSLAATLAEGLQQTVDYLDRSGAEAGHLVIFDRSAKPWADKLFQRQETQQGWTICVWGM